MAEENTSFEDPMQDLQKSLDYYKGKVDKLNKENQSLRSTRNDAVRKSHVLDKVLNAHNIKFDLGKVDMESLSIEDGVVKGEFDYSPPAAARSTASSKPPVQNNVSNPLTLEDVKGMDPQEVNARWSEIEPMLKGGY